MDIGIGGKVALISGAGRNIGRAIAMAFADEGADLLLFTRSSMDRLETVAEEARARGVRVVTCQCDVASATSVDRMRVLAEQEFEGIDIIVNNATFRVPGPLAEVDSELWRRNLGVNLDGPFNVARAFVPGMVNSGWGRVINFSGIAAERGWGVARSTAKMGIVGFTRGLAREVGEYGITVNCLAPGIVAVESDSGLGIHFNLDDAAISRHGTIDEVTWVALFLASREASYVTGQCIAVNGGATYR